MRKLAILSLGLFLAFPSVAKIEVNEKDKLAMEYLYQDDISGFLDGYISVRGGIYGRVISLKASEYDKQYQANEVRADKNYKNKLLKVTGYVTDISKDFKGDPYVSFRGSNDFNRVTAHFEEDSYDKLYDLNKKEIIDVYCVGGTMILGSPTLEKCQFLEETQKRLYKETNKTIEKAIRSGKSDDEYANKIIFYGKAYNKFIIKNQCEDEKCIKERIGAYKGDIEQLIKEDEEMQNLAKQLGIELD